MLIMEATVIMMTYRPNNMERKKTWLEWEIGQGNMLRNIFIIKLQMHNMEC